MRNPRARRHVVFYISGHGFGHAVRQIEVINALVARRRRLQVSIRTNAPRRLFDLTLDRPARIVPLEVDTGAVQHDSLALDEGETIRRAAAFHRNLDARAAHEAAWLRAARVDLVVGDIPALAFAAAAQAGCPAVAIANFTWDWIYAGYPEHLVEASDLLGHLSRAYREAALALQLPLGGGFEVFPRVEAVPFIARHARHDPQVVRRLLGLPADRPLVLVSFGRYRPPRLDWAALAHLAPYLVVTTDVPAPDADPIPAGVVGVRGADLYGRGLRYQDLVAAVDVVVTKPGYGIVSECVANDTAVLYTPRGRFREYDVLVAAMPRLLRTACLDGPDLASGRWRPHLDRVLAQPAPPERPRTDGAAVVAERLLAWLS
jgi:hypothetical protein